MADKKAAVLSAFLFLNKKQVDIPHDILLLAAPVLKTGMAGIQSINSQYHSEITRILIDYFEGGSIVTARNEFKRAMVEAFGAAFDAGWVNGGGIPPPDADALAWFNARVNAEFGYIDQLFQQARELRREDGFDYFAWVNARADGYVNSLRGVYNQGQARALRNKKKSLMVTFTGEDGKESCDTCQMLKGQRHRLSWFIAHDYIPPFGGGLDCAKGGKCQHYLETDEGYRVTE